MREPTYEIVHDHLVQRGGAERVVASMARILQADIHTSFYAPSATHPDVSEQHVRPSRLDKITWFRSHHRWSLPLLAPLFHSIRPDADTTVMSTIGWAHFARPRGRSVAYWYAPARWLYQTDVYVSRNLKGQLVRAMAPILRHLDRRAVARVDRHLAISSAIAQRLSSLYGIEADVVHPPVSFAGSPEPIEGIAPGFLLVVSRFIRYKNIDVVLDAMAKRPDLELVIAGSGPDEARLRAMAGPNVRFVGSVTDDQLAWLYQVSAGLITAAHEDFGLTPLEAAMFGTPTAALRAGGFLDTILEGVTGVFIEGVHVDHVTEAVDDLLSKSWSAEALLEHSRSFSEESFALELTSQLGGGPRNHPLPSPTAAS